ncbi:hypothetical protein CYMTET_11490 [Cymbomonas tetramitiformis]|uniref:Saposin B-type domain-containing protein n=1 Tax=Cymbomonas tetramitiformis TaxID=36881 RepID=A0AAE0LCY7_9CHLO|nr:hypothetical protein CYMTET_11490 [Cymbomonas tetramitiformis]
MFPQLPNTLKVLGLVCFLVVANVPQAEAQNSDSVEARISYTEKLTEFLDDRETRLRMKCPGCCAAATELHAMQPKPRQSKLHAAIDVCDNIASKYGVPFTQREGEDPKFEETFSKAKDDVVRGGPIVEKFVQATCAQLLEDFEDEVVEHAGKMDYHEYEYMLCVKRLDMCPRDHNPVILPARKYEL